MERRERSENEGLRFYCWATKGWSFEPWRTTPSSNGAASSRAHRSLRSPFYTSAIEDTIRVRNFKLCRTLKGPDENLLETTSYKIGRGL
jgi:hypothetical protein